MLESVAMLAFIGALGGITGGLFGIGGSVVMIPALTEFLGPNQHLYQAACMIVNFFVAAPAVVQHSRAGAIDRATVARLVPLAVAAIVAGVGLSELPVFSGPGEVYLRGLFGVFLAVVSVLELWRMRTNASRPEKPAEIGRTQTLANHRWLTASLIAIPTGLIAGLLGVGGGLVAVPLQLRWLRIPIRTAIANSACVIVATSCVGAFVKNVAYAVENNRSSQPLGLAVVLIPSAMLGSLLGSRWLHRCPVKIVKAAFFVLMLVASARLMHGAVR